MNLNISRQIVLDTETTGMNKFGVHYEGHRIIEIGAVEVVNRRLTGQEFHSYLKPNCAVDPEAFRIHGISNAFLENQPYFSNIVKKFLDFIRGSELIIHNASFDIGFLNNELRMLNVNLKKIESYCKIIDSLKLARKMFPGQRNNLNALCERYFINKDERNLHNALVDAKLLAYVFLSMTGGQTAINFASNAVKKISTTIIHDDKKEATGLTISSLDTKKVLKILRATEEERNDHEKYLDFMHRINKNCLWKQFNK